ncbi:MAG: amidohydrolase [Oscillospiraceae bacterium]|nr:amidohydrolase [Oscillospiraceae bacterium]
MDWKTVKKIDAHVHLVPEETLGWIDGVWKHAEREEYIRLMDEYNVEKAVLVPINEGATYYPNCSKTNGWLAEMMNSSDGRFISFADVLPTGGYFYDTAPYFLEQAVNEYGLKGLKLHPSNLGIPIDSLEMVPVIRTACDLKIPIMIHSYPYGGTDFNLCAPDKIHNISRVFPDGTFIISHLGGSRWQDALEGKEYVDISTFLPELVRIYGVETSNRILREFGADRLIFATDYPQVYRVEPENIYETYCEILNQMDFTDEEIEKIAYGNISDILGL